MGALDAVLYIVIAARLVVPFAIPRYPLPAILAALVIDAVDQTIFQALGAGEDVRAYQSYDKALDVYYLTVAYAAIMRNWLDPTALAIGRFLFYWRLIGVVAFELTGARPLLLVFPNAFEFFFIFYEAVRVRWNPDRLSRRQLLVTAAGIWVVIKLPQEYWIHIAQLDSTEEFAAHPWLLVVVVVALAVVAAVAARLARRLPTPDWRPTFDVDAHAARETAAAVEPRTDLRAILSMATLEKVVLISMVAIIFSQVLPSVRASNAQLVAAVTIVVVANTVISLVRVRRGTAWATTLIQFGSMMALNTGIAFTRSLLRGGGEAPFPLGHTLFYLYLISLIITLYDRYRVIGNEARRGRAPGATRLTGP